MKQSNNNQILEFLIEAQKILLELLQKNPDISVQELSDEQKASIAHFKFSVFFVKKMQEPEQKDFFDFIDNLEQSFALAKLCTKGPETQKNYDEALEIYESIKMSFTQRANECLQEIIGKIENGGLIEEYMQ